MSLRDRIDRDGFAEPFTLLDADAAAAACAAADAVLLRDGPDARSRTQSRHLDDPVLLALCTHPELLRRVRAVLGDHIVLWRSNLFPKPPGAREFAWHTDAEHWTTLLEPMRNLTAWIALEPAHASNGCLEFRPRSDDARVVVAEMPPGDCVLFDERAIHRSGANPSAARRLALAVRFTLANVRIDRSRLFPDYREIALAP